MCWPTMKYKIHFTGSYVHQHQVFQLCLLPSDVGTIPSLFFTVSFSLQLKRWPCTLGYCHSLSILTLFCDFFLKTEWHETVIPTVRYMLHRHLHHDCSKHQLYGLGMRKWNAHRRCIWRHPLLYPRNLDQVWPFRKPFRRSFQAFCILL